jgi:NagD protein
MLETATGLKAFSVGKPSPVMMRAARKELGLATDETIMIGDTMETDILGGVSMGYRTALVLSGGTQRDDLKRYAYRPDFILNSIADLCDDEAYNSVTAPLEPAEESAAA